MSECKPNQAYDKCKLCVAQDPDSPFPGIAYNPHAMDGILKNPGNDTSKSMKDDDKGTTKRVDDILTPQEIDALTEIVSPEKPKIVIPKFSVNSAVFIVYTSFDGDKSKANIRAVSFPKFEVLLKDLGLLMDDIIARYSKEFDIQPCRNVPRNLLTNVDTSDVAFLRFTPKDKSKGDAMIGYISICVIPNAQNLAVMDIKDGMLNVIPITDFNYDLYRKIKDFIIEDFVYKSRIQMAKMLPHAKGVRGKVSDKDAQNAWLTLLAYYDSYPDITYQMSQVMNSINQGLNEKPME